MGLLDLVARDLARTFDLPAAAGVVGKAKLLVRGLLTVKGLAIVGFRVSHLVGRRSTLAAVAIKQLTQAVTGADIGHRAVIGPGLRIYHPSGVVISESARIGSNLTVQSSSTIAGSTVIGDNVTIGPGARVFANVQIDDNCHLGANAVLTQSIPGEGMVLVGIPAKPLREVVRSSG
jgi:serine O-acetyltransferase